jgi:hypothetical protein
LLLRSVLKYEVLYVSVIIFYEYIKYIYIAVTSVNGITNPIYWDGKNDIGAELVPGTFSKQHFGTDPTPPPPVFNYEQNNKLPNLCCTGDIDLQNLTLTGPYSKEYGSN